MSTAGAGRWLAGIAVIAASAALAVLTGCAEDKDDTFDVSVSNITHRNVTTSSAYVAFDYSVQNAKPLEVGVVYSTLASKLNRKDIEAHKTSKNGNTAEFGVVSRGADQSWQFDADLINLADNTTYYYKPFVIIDKSDETRFVNGYYVPGTAEINEFKTEMDNLPKVTVSVEGESRTGATFTGTVSRPGAHPITERGFCYGTATTPRKVNSTVQPDAGTTTVFSFTATGLAENTTYNVCAYIDNGVDPTQYSEVKPFKTLAGTLPKVILDGVDVTSGTTATFNATINNAGDPSYIGDGERGFCFGTVPNPRKGNSTVTAVTGTDPVFMLTASNLQNVTKYYVRAYVDNKVHEVQYSDTTIEFTTPFTDKDGKTYNVEIFGNAKWMVEDYAGGGSTTRLYTWQEAFDVCPTGWHVPNNNEWRALNTALGSRANVLKYFTIGGRWWSASPDPTYPNYAFSWYVDSYGLGGDDDRYKSYTFSVRYVKDN